MSDTNLTPDVIKAVVESVLWTIDHKMDFDAAAENHGIDSDTFWEALSELKMHIEYWGYPNEEEE